MALPASGQIALSQIIAEFGGGTKLTDFYKGGLYVPNTAQNAAVPTSGEIKNTDFYGAAATPPVTLQAMNASRYTVNQSAIATITINSGSAPATVTGTGASAFTWLNSGSSASYDIYVGLSSGSTPTGSAVNTWLNLGTGRSWTLTDSQATAIGAKSCTLAVQIRPAGGGATIATATWTIDVDYSNV